MLYEVFDQYNLQVFSDVRLVVKSNKKGECVCHRSGFQHLSCNVKWAKQVNAKVTMQLTVSTAAKSGLAATLVVLHILLLHLLLQYFFSEILFAWHLTTSFWLIHICFLEKKIWVQNNIKVCDNYKHSIWHPLMIWAFALHMLKHGHNFC